MLGTHFYHETIKKTTIAVGDLFNDIHVLREDEDGNVVQDLTVPLSVGRRKKFLSRLREDWRHQEGADSVQTAKVSRQVSLPRLVVDFDGIEFDPARMTNRLNRQVYSAQVDNNEVLRTMRDGIPYNISFNVSAWTDSMNDMMQIAEQILVYFSPDMTLRINEVPEMDIIRDINLQYTGMTMDDDLQGDLLDGSFSIMQWSFQFTAEVYFSPPVSNGTEIRRVIANLRKNDDFTYQKITLEVDPFDAESEEIWTVAKTIQEDLDDPYPPE